MKKINKIPIITLGYIIGILIGLYNEKSIALFLFFITIIYLILKKTNKYIKILITYPSFIIFIISIILSNITTINKENKFEKAYENTSKITVIAVIKSKPQEKEYGTQFKVEIIQSDTNLEIKKTRLIVIDKQRYKFEYGDIIKIKGEYQKNISYKNKRSV